MVRGPPIDSTVAMYSTFPSHWKAHGQELVNTMAADSGPDVIGLLHDKTGYGVYGDHAGAQQSVQRVPMVFWASRPACGTTRWSGRLHPRRPGRGRSVVTSRVPWGSRRNSRSRTFSKPRSGAGSFVTLAELAPQPPRSCGVVSTSSTDDTSATHRRSRRRPSAVTRPGEVPGARTGRPVTGPRDARRARSSTTDE